MVQNFHRPPSLYVYNAVNPSVHACTMHIRVLQKYKSVNSVFAKMETGFRVEIHPLCEVCFNFWSRTKALLFPIGNVLVLRSNEQCCNNINEIDFLTINFDTFSASIYQLVNICRVCHAQFKYIGNYIGSALLGHFGSRPLDQLHGEPNEGESLSSIW